MRQAIIKQITGEVVNLIEIETKANWIPPEGCILLEANAAQVNPGDIWDGAAFIKAVKVESPEITRQRQAREGAADQVVAKIGSLFSQRAQSPLTAAEQKALKESVLGLIAAS